MRLLPVLAGLLLAAAVLLWTGRARNVLSMGTARESRSAPASRPTRQPAGPREVADAVDLLVLALGSGAGVPTCVELVAHDCDEQVGVQLAQVAAALRWGVETRVAWAGLPEMWQPVGTALALADTAGTPPAAELRAAAARIRTDEQHRLEVAGARVAVRLVLPLGLCFLPAFVLLTVIPVVVAMASSLLRPLP